VARFWRLDPAAVLRLTLSDFNLYELQAERIVRAEQSDA
jgi:hypothetical protein